MLSVCFLYGASVGGSMCTLPGYAGALHGYLAARSDGGWLWAALSALFAMGYAGVASWQREAVVGGFGQLSVLCLHLCALHGWLAARSDEAHWALTPMNDVH